MNARIHPLTWETGIPYVSGNFEADTRSHYRAVRLRMETAPKKPPRIVWEASKRPTKADALVTPDDPPARALEPIEAYLKGLVRIRVIIARVAEHYSVGEMDLVSHRRVVRLVLPRHVAMFLCRDMTIRTYPELGMHFGNRDHTSILHAVQKIERMIADDPVFAEQVSSLREKCLPVFEGKVTA